MIVFQQRGQPVRQNVAMVRDSVSVMESEEFNVALIATAIDPASTHESLAHLLHTGAGDLVEGDDLVQESLEWRAVWDNREDPWKALPYLYSYVARGEPEGEEEARGVPVALLGEEDVANDLASIFAQEWSEDIYRQLFALVEAGGASGLENGREVGTRDALARFLERKREGIERALTERMRPKPRETAAKVAPREVEAEVVETRGRGRPRKLPNPEATPPKKRGPGRPRKRDSVATGGRDVPPAKKRGPGRPRKNPLPAEDERPPSVWEPKFRKWQKLVSLEDAVYAALKNPEEYRIPTILPKSMRARAAAAVKVVAKHKRRREEGRGR